jgi:kinetochore protein Spc24
MTTRTTDAMMMETTDMDAAATDAAFRECYELVEEMTRIYASDEDAARVREVSARFDEVRTQCVGREEHMMGVIKEMSRRVQVAERKAILPPTALAARERVMKLEGEKRAAGERLNAMEREAEQLEREQEALSKQAEGVKLERQRLDAVVNEEIPATKREVSLYAHISNIAWHYEVEDRISGHVNAKAARDVRKIDIPIRPGNAFHVAQTLWDMME